MIKGLLRYATEVVLGGLIGGLIVLGIFFTIMKVYEIKEPLTQSEDWYKVKSNSKMIIINK